MGGGDILLGVTLQWTSIPSRGKGQYSQLLHATETGISSVRVGLLRLVYDLPYLYLRCTYLYRINMRTRRNILGNQGTVSGERENPNARKKSGLRKLKGLIFLLPFFFLQFRLSLASLSANASPGHRRIGKRQAQNLYLPLNWRPRIILISLENPSASRSSLTEYKSKPGF